RLGIDGGRVIERLRDGAEHGILNEASAAHAINGEVDILPLITTWRLVENHIAGIGDLTIAIEVDAGALLAEVIRIPLRGLPRSWQPIAVGIYAGASGLDHIGRRAGCTTSRPVALRAIVMTACAAIGSGHT